MSKDPKNPQPSPIKFAKPPTLANKIAKQQPEPGGRDIRNLRRETEALSDQLVSSLCVDLITRAHVIFLDRSIKQIFKNTRYQTFNLVCFVYQTFRDKKHEIFKNELADALNNYDISKTIKDFPVFNLKNIEEIDDNFSLDDCFTVAIEDWMSRAEKSFKLNSKKNKNKICTYANRARESYFKHTENEKLKEVLRAIPPFLVVSSFGYGVGETLAAEPSTNATPKGAKSGLSLGKKVVGFLASAVAIGIIGFLLPNQKFDYPGAGPKKDYTQPEQALSIENEEKPKQAKPTANSAGTSPLSVATSTAASVPSASKVQGTTLIEPTSETTSGQVPNPTTTPTESSALSLVKVSGPSTVVPGGEYKVSVQMDYTGQKLSNDVYFYVGLLTEEALKNGLASSDMIKNGNDSNHEPFPLSFSATSVVFIPCHSGPAMFDTKQVSSNDLYIHGTSTQNVICHLPDDNILLKGKYHWQARISNGPTLSLDLLNQNKTSNFNNSSSNFIYTSEDAVLVQ